MKKIGILTFHNACNYGAFLQTKALSEFINEQCEREVYIVDYKNKSIINDYSVRNVFNFNQGLKTTILKIMRLPDILKRNSIFNMYQKESFKLVKVNDISEYKISKVVVGSDQVWNLELTGGDLNYFLPFVEPECRISYAASVGHVGDNIDKKIFEEKLSLFDSISVREKELADMINSLNINKKAVICMDPVFLKSKLAWKEYIADTEININLPYILVFIMGVVIMFLVRYIDVNKTIHMKIKKTIIIGSIAIGTMLIVTYYCNNKALQSISLCITVIYAMVTNIDMLRLGIELVKKRLYNKNDRGINGRKKK